MERLLKLNLAAGLVAACTLAAPARAVDVSLLVDLRFVESSGQTSWLNGGLGKLRFDPDHDGLRLGLIYLGLDQSLTETVALHVNAMAYGDHDRNPIDLTEAYFEWRPFPGSAWRQRAKLGAFYPSISFENPLPGWRSPYSISWSALNTWIGEEIRSIGAEYSLDYLGVRNGGRFDFGAQVGVYGWNDPAGVLIAERGWALHDRQTTLFGRIGIPEVEPVEGYRLFYEIDHRPGYYVGVKASYLDRAELRLMHYDNRGDRVSYSAAINDMAWETLFDSAGLQVAATEHLTLIAQVLDGETWINPFLPIKWDFDAQFLLASYEWRGNRLTLRHDWFSMQRTGGRGLGNDSGHAWTIAAGHEFGEHWSAMVEGLWVNSSMPQRPEFGAPVAARESSLTLSLRYALKH
jgi:hypothetical protein